MTKVEALIEISYSTSGPLSPLQLLSSEPLSHARPLSYVTTSASMRDLGLEQEVVLKPSLLVLVLLVELGLLVF